MWGLAAVVAAFVVPAAHAQTTYVWNQTASAPWTTATNWTPTRTTPATNDVLVFNNGATTIATNVPTQTIGQLQVSGSTSATLQAAAAATLTLAGGAGVDLSVAAGSTLQLSGANAVTLAIATGATGDIAGTTTLAGGAHRLLSLDAGSLVYESGAKCVANTGFTGNAFGDGTGSGGLSSVVFQAGSLYQHVAGANPFGAAQPNSAVTFQAGSRYRLDAALTPSMAGRTYADFEYNNAGTQSVTGAAAVTMDSLVVTQGTFNLNLTGGASVHGDVHVKSGATLGMSPASAATVSLNGSAAQAIDAQGTLTTSANATLGVNNAAGVSLVTNLSLGGGLSFTSGLLNTGARTLTLAAASAVSGAAQGTGWVNGTLTKNYATGAFSGSLDVGDASTYAPIGVSGTGAPPPTAMRSAAGICGMASALAVKSLTTSKRSSAKWRLRPLTVNDQGWLVSVMASPVTGEATASAASRGAASCVSFGR